MKKLFKNTVLVSLLFICNNNFAQVDKNNFTIVDNYVKKIGSLDTLNAGTISYLVTKNFKNNSDKVRAIFDWIAFNISLDCKATKNNSTDKNYTDNILKTRKATAMGYAALFQDMCSAVKIRCLTVDGYVKHTGDDMNEKPDGFNHTWDVVQLGQSPEQWYYVDPTWGSGYADEKVTNFTKAYNNDYFFADKTIFNFQHFPENIHWQLGDGAKSLKEFTTIPLVTRDAFGVGLKKFEPSNGFVKTKLAKPVLFKITVTDTTKIDIVSIRIGADKRKQKTKTVDYTATNGLISFSFKFDEADIYPISVLINNKPILYYNIEVVE